MTSRLYDTRIQELATIIQQNERLHKFDPQTVVFLVAYLLDVVKERLGDDDIRRLLRQVGLPDADPQTLLQRCAAAGMIVYDKQTNAYFMEIRRRRIAEENQEIGGLTGVVDAPGGGGIQAVFIEAGRPRTSYNTLTQIFSSLSGHVRICDPYCGADTLTKLDLLTHCGPVQFLTKNLHGKGTRNSVEPLLRDFRIEHPQFEFREHVSSDLHDRYVIAGNGITLIGHGLKDIGGKDSFVVRLPRDFSGDMIDEVAAAFDSKWGNANPIP